MPEEGPEEKIAARPQSRLRQWFDRRTGVNDLLRKSLDEPIPGGARFAYIFGSGLLFLFISQIITGLCLTLYYVPSAETAHVSVSYIVKEVSAGAFLRSLHAYGSSAIIVVLLLHFLQTFLYGSYKGKRELLWISGCLLSLLILGMAFTGYLLPWDQKAYFATSVGTNIAGQVPFIGEYLRRLLRGGSAMGTLTISRFYVLHVFIIPASVFFLVAIHIFMFRKAGAAGPMNEDPVQPRMRSEMFYPKQVIMDMAFALSLIVVLGLLAYFHPVQLGPIADPNDSHYLPRPEWYFLPMFQWLKYWEGPRTVIGIIVIPTVLVALFFLLPFLDRGPERRPWRRPIPLGAVLIVLLGAIWLGVISHRNDVRDPGVAAQLAQQEKAESQFFHAPFEPYLVTPPSAAAPATMNGPAVRGKTIFDSQGCNGCHGENGIGGTIGPALTHVGEKFQDPELIAVLKDPTAKMRAGHMTPVGLDATSMSALVSFLRALGTSGSIAAAAPTAMPLSDEKTSASSPIAAASANPAPGPVRSADTSAGRQIFQTRACFACHGEGGVGTPRGPALLGISNKFSAQQITERLKNPTALMKAGGMAPVSGSDQELGSLVAYLSSLKKAPGAMQAKISSPQKTLTKAEASEASVTPRAPASTPQATPQDQTAKISPAPAGQPRDPQFEQGKALFDARGCAACHGADGKGTRLAIGLIDAGQRMQPIEMVNLLHHPNQKMRAGGMPAVDLNEQDMLALIAYVRHFSAKLTTTGASAPLSAPQSIAPTQSASIAAIATGPPLNTLELQGQAIFAARRCASCHGADGVGGTAAASGFTGRGNLPPDVLANMLRHPTAVMQQGGMPPVSVTDSELKALVAYVSYISLSSAKH